MVSVNLTLTTDKRQRMSEKGMTLDGLCLSFLGAMEREGARESGRAITGYLAAGDQREPKDRVVSQRGRCGGGAQDVNDAFHFEPGAISWALVAEADADESAPFCRDTGGAAGNQCDQGSHCGDGLAGEGAARC